jgi:hypothetical protein
VAVRALTFNGLHGVISQKIVLFISQAVSAVLFVFRIHFSLLDRNGFEELYQLFPCRYETRPF